MISIYDDENAKKRIEESAESLEIGSGTAIFEHDAWFFQTQNEEGELISYSVNDASGHPSHVCSGVCFELLQ